MPDFQYVARSTSGEQVTGTLSAGSEHEALTSLAARQLFPLRVGLVESAKTLRKRIGKRVGGRQTAVVYTQLADLLRSGVPLLRSLELLQRHTRHATLKAVLEDVCQQVADGTALAESMRRHPGVFDELCYSMVHAGEEGGFLEDVLKRVAAFTEHQQELKGRVLAAMVYPAFLVVAGGAIISAMLVFFVPRFAPVFDRMRDRGQLQWSTTTLISISEAAQNHGLLLVLLGGAAVAGVVAWSKTEAGRERLDRVRLRTPGLGNVVRSLAISRFCRVLGTLLRNGVPILQAMRIAKGATGNVHLSRSIGAAAESISEGKFLAEPLAASGEFPPDVVEMIAVGEQSANLEEVLINIAESMERRTQRQLDLLVRMVEPVLLTILATMILFLVIALLSPILQSSGLL